MYLKLCHGSGSWLPTLKDTLNGHAPEATSNIPSPRGLFQADPDSIGQNLYFKALKPNSWTVQNEL